MIAKRDEPLTDDEIEALLDQAMREAFCDAVRAHRATRIPLVFWENGQVVRVDPNEVSIDEPASGD